MPADTVEIEVWVVVNENGDYVVGRDQSEAAEAYRDNIGGDDATRHVKVTLRVPKPVPVELSGDVPAEASGGVLRVG